VAVDQRLVVIRQCRLTDYRGAYLKLVGGASAPNSPVDDGMRLVITLPPPTRHVFTRVSAIVTILRQRHGTCVKPPF
jgi:hypothetical protein